MLPCDDFPCPSHLPLLSLDSDEDLRDYRSLIFSLNANVDIARFGGSLEATENL